MTHLSRVTAECALGQLLAEEAARLLPDHPRVRSSLSYARIPGAAPSVVALVPARAANGPREPALVARFQSLPGYPIVIDA